MKIEICETFEYEGPNKIWQVKTSSNGTNWLIVYSNADKAKCWTIGLAYISVGFENVS